MGSNTASEEISELLEKGQTEEALEKALAIPWGNPEDDLHKYLNIIRSYQKLGQLETAKTYLDEALTKYSNSAVLWMALANYHVSWGEYALARAAFDKAGEKDANDPMIQAKRAWMRCWEGDFKGGLSIYKKLQKHYASDHCFQFTLAYCMLIVGCSKEAEIVFRDMLGRGKSDMEIYVGLFWAYYDQAMLENAAKTLEDAIRKYTNCEPELYAYLAVVYIEMNKPRKALLTVLAGLRAVPGSGKLGSMLKALEIELNCPDPQNKLKSDALMILMESKIILRTKGKPWE